MSDFSIDALTEADLPFLLEVRNECRNFLHDPRTFELEACRQWFRSNRPDFRVIRHGGERIGYFRLSQHDAAGRSVYVGADLHQSFRGRGLAKRAYEELFALLRAGREYDTVKLEVLSHNTVAMGLYRRLGFVETGRHADIGVREGKSVDSIIMERPL
jgi:RimJ/RimL family protein N-acetyltransferase